METTVQEFKVQELLFNCYGKVNSDNIEKLHRRAARLILRHHSSDEALQFLAHETMGAKNMYII